MAVLELCLLMPSPEVPGGVPGVLGGVQRVDELSWALPNLGRESRMCFPQEYGSAAMI